MREESIDVITGLHQQAPLAAKETQDQTLVTTASIRAAAVAAAATLAACGGGGGASGGSGAAAAPATVVKGDVVKVDAAAETYKQLTIAAGNADDAKIARFLQQAQFAATDEDIASVKSKGYVKWLEETMAEQSFLAWDWLNSKGYALDDLVSSSSSIADSVAWNQLLETRNAFRKRAALALSEILVVSVNGLNASWRTHTITHYWDTLCKHAFGNYRDLLEAMTKNIGMGYYLNVKGSRYRSGVQPDENYAREIMQLFTIGLVDLEDDGTVKIGGGNTYTKEDVSALAHVFTGWDADNSANTPDKGEAFTQLPMKLDKSKHSTVSVKAFGGKLDLPATLTGEDRLKRTLDYLFNHPNTAPYICKQLIQRLVTSNPSPAYVARVVAKFKSNNPIEKKKGDLGAVFAAILLDDEARGAVPSGRETEFGKLREPVVRLVQWARTFNVQAPNGIPDLSDPGKQLGQSPWRSPSVFNFFRPGYMPQATTLSPGSVAPEFQIANETSVAGYLNFMMQTVRDGIRGQSSMKAAYTKELALAANPTALLQRLNILLCGGQLSPGTANDIKRVLDSITGTDSARMRVCAAVVMVMASADYLIQK
jgi:uncharacterized protein (DUF1800 family)